ncbi:MAG: glycosyltransferase family 2 protein [Pseudomonadota bacterium]
MRCIARRTSAIRPGDILLFCTQRNELTRLPFFLDYHRGLGVKHFLFVDNASDDGSTDYLTSQPDCSVWRSQGSYKRARFGMDWLNHLLARYGAGHWTLTVDVDEFLVYPHCDSRPLSALTDWLDASGIKALGTLLIDMYGARPPAETPYRAGDDPMRAAPYFDAGNYQYRRDGWMDNLWIQGGPRQRVFFADAPNRAPALNKIPLVRWQRGYVYASSTHSLLPRGLNRVYDEWGGERPAGALMHPKFLQLLGEKSAEELHRRQHYANSREYRAYADGVGRSLWTPASTRFTGWRHLQDLGLISHGGWL